MSYDRGTTGTYMATYAMQGNQSIRDNYDEPQVNVLEKKRKQQLAEALNQSYNRGDQSRQEEQLPAYPNDSNYDSGAITADNLLIGHQDAAMLERRNQLERALANDAPILELVIQSSATLVKGEKI